MTAPTATHVPKNNPLYSELGLHSAAAPVLKALGLEVNSSQDLKTLEASFAGWVHGKGTNMSAAEAEAKALEWMQRVFDDAKKVHASSAGALPTVAEVRHSIGLTDDAMLEIAKNASGEIKKAIEAGIVENTPHAYKDAVHEAWRQHMLNVVHGADKAKNPYGMALALDNESRLEGLWKQLTARLPDAKTSEQKIATVTGQKEALFQKIRTASGQFNETESHLPPGFAGNLAAGFGVMVASSLAANKISHMGSRNIVEGRMKLASDATGAEAESAKKQVVFGKVQKVAAGAAHVFGLYALVVDASVQGPITRGVKQAWNAVWEALSGFRGRG